MLESLINGRFFSTRGKFYGILILVFCMLMKAKNYTSKQIELLVHKEEVFTTVSTLTY